MTSLEPRARNTHPATMGGDTDLIVHADSVGPIQCPHDHDILTTAEGSNRLGVFVDFMRAAGLAELLLQDGPFTVLAPTDRAFSKLSIRERDALLADNSRLKAAMRGHVLLGRVQALPGSEPVLARTLDGRDLTISFVNGSYRVANARLVQTNIPASNGTIHAIESVLRLPERVVQKA